jgi:hypothetical protein
VAFAASSAHAGLSSGLSDAKPLNATIGTGAIIRVETNFSGPNEAQKLDIMLENNSGIPVGGVQFHLYLGNVTNASFPPDADDALDESLTPTGFMIKSNYSPDGDTLKVVVFQSDGSAIFDTETILAQLNYTAADALCTESPVEVVDESIGVSSFSGGDIPGEGEDGLIQIGIRGDLNCDGRIDIRDAVLLVLHILSRGLLEGPEGVSVVDEISDVNQDEGIDVADVIGIVNIILGLPIEDGVSTKPVAGGSVIDLGTPMMLDDGQLAVPVLLDTRHLIAGAQMTFTFDPSLLRIGKPQLTGESRGLVMDSKATDGTLRVIVYSLQADRGLATGDKPAFLIPVVPLGDAAAELTLTDVVLSNRQARTVPVELGGMTQRVTKEMLAPKAFALRNNAPNPFNPTTTISYEVPQQAHITVVVYNLLGQEVIRLVDKVQTPGRYQVVWDARNAQGHGVASGVYMYRLISSTGFSETKRMTLLK